MKPLIRSRMSLFVACAAASAGGLALLIAFTLGIALGMVMAYKRESVLDHVLSALGSLFHSIPNYLLALSLLRPGDLRPISIAQ